MPEAAIMLWQSASPSPVATEMAAEMAAEVAGASGTNVALPAPSPQELLLADEIVQRAAAEGHAAPLAIVQAASMILLSAAASPSPSPSPSPLDFQLASPGVPTLAHIRKVSADAGASPSPAALAAAQDILMADLGDLGSGAAHVPVAVSGEVASGEASGVASPLPSPSAEA